MGAALRTIPVGETVKSHFRDIGHSLNDQDVTYENAQARERTQVLMDVANPMVRISSQRLARSAAFSGIKGVGEI